MFLQLVYKESIANIREYFFKEYKSKIPVCIHYWLRKDLPKYLSKIVLEYFYSNMQYIY